MCGGTSLSERLHAPRIPMTAAAHDTPIVAQYIQCSCEKRTMATTDAPIRSAASAMVPVAAATRSRPYSPMNSEACREEVEHDEPGRRAGGQAADHEQAQRHAKQHIPAAKHFALHPSILQRRLQERSRTPITGRPAVSMARSSGWRRGAKRL